MAVDPKRETRKGVWERVKGKTKKAVGGAVGSERLVTSGELHEVQADAHVEAAERQVRADELREEAVEDFVEREAALDGARQAARASTAQQAQTVEQRRKQRRTAVERQTQARREATRRQADTRKRAVAAKEQQAKQQRQAVQKRAGSQRKAAQEARQAAKTLDEVQQDLDES